MQPQISVAIATYNGGKYLREQLESICSQTVLPYELVVSDDGSRDDTLLIVNDYKSRLRIKVINDGLNKGINKNFETAIRACTGDFIMICDQDDIWLPPKIETHYYYMQQMLQKYGSAFPILISSESHRFSDTSPLIPSYDIQDKGAITDVRCFIFSYNSYNQGSTLMFNRALLDYLNNFPNDFSEVPYDYYISSLTLFKGVHCHVKKTLMLYRVHENNAFEKKHSKSFCYKIKWRIRFATYSLFKCTPEKIDLLNRAYKEFGPLQQNSLACNCIPKLSEYSKQSFYGKIRIIFSMDGVTRIDKIIQFFTFIITAPLRLFLKY